MVRRGLSVITNFLLIFTIRARHETDSPYPSVVATAEDSYLNWPNGKLGENDAGSVYMKTEDTSIKLIYMVEENRHDNKFISTGANQDTNVQEGWTWQYGWSVAVGLQFFFSGLGIVGNGLVVIALAQHRTISNSIDTFVGALAVADLSTSVFMIPTPTAIYVPRTVLGALYCKVIFTNYLMWVCAHSSAYILTGMSAERLIAVVYPLHFKRVLTRRNVRLFLLTVWLFSIPSALFSVEAYEVSDNKCKMSRKSPVVLIATPVYICFLRLFIPAFVMIVTQIITAVSLNRQSRREPGQMARAVAHRQAKRSFHVEARNSVVKLTFIIVVIYILTIGPNQLSLLISTLRGELLPFLFSPIHDALTLLTFINSCANPLIYAARYPKFRAAIKSLIIPGSSAKDDIPLFGPATKPKAEIYAA
ncbi:allatostatin-A receptor-like [Diadema antillarum]|uniref:allatostatin-A receptor-like n=1 Tax=Diadema antillarum TaxID=105358 RepID=UPI003A840E0B